MHNTNSGGYISIHALRVEGDPHRGRPHLSQCRFLSTPSGWRATISAPADTISVIISIHALRVEGDIQIVVGIAVDLISIHALRMEGDVFLDTYERPAYPISIHALRMEGDSHLLTCTGDTAISIHALRMEGDSRRDYIRRLRRDFYPRPPDGGRPR